MGRRQTGILEMIVAAPIPTLVFWIMMPLFLLPPPAVVFADMHVVGRRSDI